jgi:hypothetical protein
MNGRRTDFITLLRMSGGIVGSFIATFMIVQSLVTVLILKNRFSTLNERLSAILRVNCEENGLETLASMLDISNKVNAADSVIFVGDPPSVKHPKTLFLSVNKLRRQVFYHDRHYIRSLRQTHAILCDVIQMINSDYGLQILLIISYAFMSFVMFTFLALDAEIDPSVADCNEEESCVRVLMNFCVSCTCIIKVMSIAGTCHAASAEASRTSTVVQKLLSQAPVSSDMNAELQLFSQQMWNIDTKFTAFGFFELNLNLLCSIAGTATTYIVVLLQLK